MALAEIDMEYEGSGIFLAVYGMVQTEVKKSGWHVFAAHSRFLCCIQMLTGRESMAPLGY
jgi:hypothetical protein